VAGLIGTAGLQQFNKTVCLTAGPLPPLKAAALNRT